MEHSGDHASPYEIQKHKRHQKRGKDAHTRHVIKHCAHRGLLQTQPSSPTCQQGLLCRGLWISLLGMVDVESAMPVHTPMSERSAARPFRPILQHPLCASFFRALCLTQHMFLFGASLGKSRTSFVLTVSFHTRSGWIVCETPVHLRW